jgi:hypothetical protein
MDGCVLREVYAQQDGLNGESFSLWREGANVRHKADRSKDGGRTWAPVQDMSVQRCNIPRQRGFGVRIRRARRQVPHYGVRAS